MKTALALVVIMVPLFSGCFEPPPFKSWADEYLPPPPYTYPHEPMGLNISGILIEQTQDSGPPPGVYMGTIDMVFCIRNQNDFPVMMEAGFEVYQVMGPPHQGELRVVDESHDGPRNWQYDGNYFPWHHVYYNETVEGNSTEYRIHYWHHVLLDPDTPIHRVDRWFNLTFTPYTNGEVYHQEGQDCWTPTY